MRKAPSRRRACGALTLLVLAAARPGHAGDSRLELYEDGETRLKATVQLDTAFFHEWNPWWGRATQLIGGNGNDWMELALSTGLEGQLELGPGRGLLHGRVSGLLSLTAGGLDAAGSNLDPRTPSHVDLEDAWIGWRSGEALPRLGKDALQLSVGSQPYRVGSGLLFWTGATNGATRGGFWLAPRNAFAFAGIARLQSRGVTGELVVLRPNDAPNTSTWLWGTNWELAFGEDGVYGSVGAGYWRAWRSQLLARDDLSIYDVRFDLTPLAGRERLPGLRVAGEIALETGRRGGTGYAWFGEGGYAFDAMPGEPYASYRYAFFSGPSGRLDERRRFDPLYYGGSDWGSWYVGEILGNFALTNTNVALHTVRLRAAPVDSLNVNLLFHHAELDRLPREIVSRVSTRLANVRSTPIAEELDLVVEWEATDWLSFTAAIGAAFPNDAAKEYTGGSATWVHTMLSSRIAF